MERPSDNMHGPLESGAVQKTKAEVRVARVKKQGNYLKQVTIFKHHGDPSKPVHVCSTGHVIVFMGLHGP